MKINISIIIVHWNTLDLLEKLLCEVFDKNYNNIEVIVVDNHSKKSLEDLQKMYTKVKFIKNSRNYGYSHACNQGVISAKGDWLVFFNPDVLISANEVEEIIQFAQKNKLDAISPQSNEDHYAKPIPSVFSLISEFSPLGKINFFRYFKHNKTLTGGALFIKKTTIVSIGGWDERFFLWFEDSDLTKRLHQYGYKFGWYPKSINHTGAGSIKKMSSNLQRSLFFYSMNIFSLKHFSVFGKKIISFLSNHYSKNKTLPILETGISIVVPNMHIDILKTFFDGNWKYLRENIESGKLELIVVSSDLSNSDIWNFRKLYRGVRFIPIKKNNGFAATVNIGFRSSTKQWMGTCNDDVVLNNFWLNSYLKYSMSEIGSVNPIITDENGDIESAGIRVFPKGKAIPIRKFDNDKEIIEADATNAAAVIYSHEALEEVGLFDEKFGSYLEDIDLSLRLSKAGYQNLVCTTSKIIHYRHSTSKDMKSYKQWLDLKNWWILIIKNWQFNTWIKYFPSIFIERLRNLSGYIKAVFK